MPLRVDEISGVCIGDGGYGLGLFRDSSGVVEFDVSLGNVYLAVVRVTLLECFLGLGVLFLVRGWDNAPTASPWARAQSSVLNFDLFMITRMLFSILPFSAIREPV